MKSKAVSSYSASYHRHDLPDRVWERLEPHLPGSRGTVGRLAFDNHRFLQAVFWILRAGAPCRDLLPDYRDWQNTRCRFCPLAGPGVWERLLDAVIDAPDLERLMIDANHIKAHPHEASTPRGNQAMAQTKGG